ncbi:hypothetical protein F5Y01DRAFT_319204 [Xylaria sp. FL0043]|nr:hypothetical protein F5Y01DRAFT_319204 [Xylaria sp. FL0043]
MSNSCESTTWLDQPLDVLMEIMSHCDKVDRINLAMANPEVFLGPQLNIFVVDAQRLVQLADQISDDDSDETEISTTNQGVNDDVPFLQVAIENDMSFPVIRKILAEYRSVCPDAINGAWGRSSVPYDLPLIKATALGKVHIVSLLLDEGADPFVHSEGCKGFDPQYKTSMEAAFRAAQRRGAGITQSYCDSLEDCALLLHMKKGVPFSTPVEQATTSDNLITRLKNPVASQFTRVVKTILMAECPRKKRTWVRRVLLITLRDFCRQYGDPRYQRLDDTREERGDARDLIEFLLRIGAPLEGHRRLTLQARLGRPLDYDTTLLGKVLRANRFKTAIFLLHNYVDSRVAIEFMDLTSAFLDPLMRRWPEAALAITQELFEVMKKAGSGIGFGYLGKKKASAEELHNFLLAGLVTGGKVVASRWLIEQGVGTPGFLSGNYRILPYLVENALTYSHDEDDWWSAAMIAIGYGASASFAVGTNNSFLKGRLAAEFGRTYSPLTYEESCKTITPDMLRPEYFLTMNGKQVQRAMFHYMLGYEERQREAGLERLEQLQES